MTSREPLMHLTTLPCRKEANFDILPNELIICFPTGYPSSVYLRGPFDFDAVFEGLRLIRAHQNITARSSPMFRS